MHGTIADIPQQSTKISRKAFRSPEKNFGRIARALWPRKTAAEIATRAGVTPRTAELWLAGHEPSARAVLAVLNEVLS